MDEDNVTNGINERVFCQYCKSPLDTDFERSKEAHWDCHDIIKTESVIREYSPNIITEVSESFNDQLSSLTTYKPVKLIACINDDIIERANDKWGLDYVGMYPLPHQLGIANLRPKHLGLRDNIWKIVGTGQNEWVDWVYHFVNVNIFVAITGIFVLNQTNITEIQFTANGIDLPISNIEIINSLHEKVLWLAKPFAVSPDNMLKISIFSSILSRVEYFGIMGHVIGKRDYLVNKYI